MRTVRTILGVVSLVVAAFGTANAQSDPFHSGGVGYCGGCHVTHADAFVLPGPDLLIGRNSTDTCLRCHATGPGNTWGTDLLAPGPVYGGGSFIFLTEENLNDGPGGADPANWIPGHRAGHNVVSVTRGVATDPDNAVAPGGVYPSEHLTCTSCHDPHNKAGNFRMLYGDNSPASRSNGYLYEFTVPPPVGVGIELSGSEESRSNHTAYVDNWQGWCQQCHDRFHDTGTPTFDHPAYQTLGGDERGNYDVYDGTGYWTSGDSTTSYLPLVPYESSDATTTSTGPTPSDASVFCLSCHRAHASSAPYAGRWDFNAATWADEGVPSGSFEIPNPYVNTSGDAQQTLCEKCHGQNVPN